MARTQPSRTPKPQLYHTVGTYTHTSLLTLCLSPLFAQIQIGEDIDGEAAYDLSGRSVSLSSDGSRVAIGAYGNNGNGTSAGHVRVYALVGGIWEELGAYDLSGTSVSLSSDGSRVAISARYNNGNGTEAGHVRLYDFVGDSWQQVGVDIDGEAAGDWSGYSVSLSPDGSRVAIGARYNDDNGSNSGHVRIYEKFFSITLYENNPACIGADNGALQILSNGVTHPYSYSYNLSLADGTPISTSLFETSNFTITDLAAGDYTFSVLDATSDTVHQESITTGGIPGSFFEITDITTLNSVNGFPNGNIVITVAGGIADYNYSWSGQETGSNVSATESLEMANLSPGIYTVTITDLEGNFLEQSITLLDETNPEQTCVEPLDIVILNDVSGSVDAIEYEESKQFFADFCAALNVGPNAEDSRVAIVEWSDSEDQQVMVPITGDLPTLQNYVNSVRAYDGGTNPNAALTFGHDYLEAEGRDEATKVLVLSTDGTSGQVSSSLAALSET